MLVFYIFIKNKPCRTDWEGGVRNIKTILFLSNISLQQLNYINLIKKKLKLVKLFIPTFM